MSGRRAVFALALTGALAIGAGEPPVAGRERLAGSAGAPLPLGGTLVAALAPGDSPTLWLLVRPLGQPDGPRRLLRVALDGEPPAAPVALDGLGGWIKTLAALRTAAGVHLVAGGLGRLVDLGPLAAPGGEGRALVEHPGFDLRSLAASPLRTGIDPLLATAEAGHLRLWRPGREGLELASDRALPTTVERTAAGWEVASPPTAALAGTAERTWLAGPLELGRSRLRSWRFDGEQSPGVELVSALPGPERVEQSWAVTFDGVPALVAQTQGAARIDLLERQRLRVLPLAADRTRAGAAPALAVELDAKRWQPTRIAVGDVDGDGHDDLVAAYAEGLTGGDLVVEVWSGQGGLRFARRSRRSDLDDPPRDWLLLPPARTGQPMTLLGVWSDRVELRALAVSGRRALEREPLSSAPLPAAGRSKTEVTVALGGPPGAAVERRSRSEALGRAGGAVLVLAPDADGGDQLVIVRDRPLAPSR